MTERGARRRTALVEAAAALLEAEGFEALTHRAVAGRAALPLAATTYYFASLGELVEEALRLLVARYLAAGRARAAALPSGPVDPQRMAVALVGVIAGLPEPAERGSLLTFYERYIQAGRHPHLQPLVREWNAQLQQLVRAVLSSHGYPGGDELPRLVLAVVDGLLIAALVEGDEDPMAGARATLAGLLERGWPLRPHSQA